MSLKKLTFAPVSNQVLLTGTTAPGATVRAENLSAAPFGPSNQKDIYASTTADAQGRFSLPVPLAEQGDKVRVTVEGQPGAPQASRILGVRLQQAALVDGRRAEVGHQGLRLVADGQGGYAFENVRKNRKLGEPGVAFELRNTRSGEVTAFRLDARGQLPERARVQGQPGDLLTLHVTDGRHNAYMGADGWGSFILPKDGQPAPTRDLHGATLAAYTGPLFVDGVDARDAVQGQVGDCYLVASAAALAHAQPDALRKLFRENADGTVTVTFRAWDEAQAAYKEVPVTVDRALPQRWGKPAYGADDGTTAPAAMETWFAVLEKAYATWKGGYEAMSCGYPYEIFEALLGTEGVHVDTRGMDEAALQKALGSMVENKQALVCWTGGEAAGRAFTNSGLYGDHAYTLLGVEARNGQDGVVLRNPWGRGEPRADARDDGVFWMPMAQFKQYFVGVGGAAAA